MPLPDLPRIGVRLHGGLAPRRCIELAQIVEANGFASLWFAENPFHRGVLPAVSACVAATRRIHIGIGVVNPYSRHPSLIAMEFAALDELAQGRALLGIGPGIGAQIERMGFKYRPLATMQDAVHIVRAMLRGDTVTYRGPVFSVEAVALGFRPLRPDLPIYMAAMGDRSLELCGRIADGLIVSNMCPPAYTERAVGIVRRGAAGTPRDIAQPNIVQYVPAVIRPDRVEARRAVKAAMGDMLAAFWPTNAAWPPVRDTIVRCSGIPKAEVMSALVRLRGGESADAVLDDRYIDAFAIAGNAEDCLAQAMRYRHAGVAELALTFAGDQPAIDMAYFGAALRACLRTRPLNSPPHRSVDERERYGEVGG